MPYVGEYKKQAAAENRIRRRFKKNKSIQL
jgi:hypothetical protein